MMTSCLASLMVLLVLGVGLRQSQCQQTDQNQEVSDSNMSWIPSDQIPCDDDYDCDVDYNVCVSGVCRCDVNYRLVDNHCVRFSCQNDSECQTYDENAVCEDMFNKSSCVCKSQYEFDNDQRLCRIADNHFKWLLALVSVPLALVLMSCWFVYRTKTRARPRDRCHNGIQCGTQCSPQSPETTRIIITDWQSLQSYPDLELFMASRKWQSFEFNTGLDVNNSKRITSVGIDSRERQIGLGLT